MAHSSTVTNGGTATAQQYNDVRTDALEKIRESQVYMVGYSNQAPAGGGAWTAMAGYTTGEPTDAFIGGPLYTGATILAHGNFRVSSSYVHPGTIALYDETNGSVLLPSKVIAAAGTFAWLTFGTFLAPASETRVSVRFRMASDVGNRVYSRVVRLVVRK